MKGARVAAVLLGALALAAPVTLSAACGARSGLFPLESTTTESANDAAVLDDVLTFDDVAVVVPPLDAKPPEDVIQVRACADASDTLVYLVTTSNSLLKFNPASTQFTRIGTLECPDPFGRSPFSMAVNRLGNAYVLYFAPGALGAPPPEPGSIFKVDLDTADCQPTGFVPGQNGFLGFGMGFSSEDDGGETLYVATGATNPSTLGAIDETSLSLSVVGLLPPYVLGAELTGTGDGRLFAFYNPNFTNGAPNTGGSYIGQIDKTTAAIIGQVSLPEITQGGGWAFAFWGGNFYTFTSPDSATTIIQRYDPIDGTVVQIATYPEVIDGAGVSTCAPVQ